MACDISTLQQTACTNGYGGLSDRKLRESLLVLLCNANSGGGGIGEVLTGAFSDPNGNVTPTTTTSAAIYYQDHASIVNQWRWSVADQVWHQNIGP